MRLELGIDYSWCIDHLHTVYILHIYVASHDIQHVMGRFLYPATSHLPAIHLGSSPMMIYENKSKFI